VRALLGHGRSAAHLVAATGASLANSFAIAILFAHLADAESYGVYQIGLAATGLAGVIALSGSATAATRAAAQGRPAAWPLFTARLPYCAAASGALALAGVTIAVLGGSAALGEALLAIAVTLPAYLGADVYPAQLLGERRYRAYLILQLGVQAATALGVAVALAVAPGEPWLALLALCGLTGGLYLVGVLRARRHASVAPEDVAYARRITIATALAAVSSRIDVLATGALLGARESGLVGIARLFSNALKRVWETVSPMLFVDLAVRDRQAGLRLAGRLRPWIFTGLAVPALAGIIAASWLVLALFGSEFEDATTVTQLFLLAAAIAPLGFPETVYLKAHGDVRRLSVSYVLLPLFALGVTPGLVFFYGLTGVGLASVATAIVSVALFVALPRSARFRERA
jgi:O-antigen/teichoic acid export membrane protein